MFRLHFIHHKKFTQMVFPIFYFFFNFFFITHSIAADSLSYSGRLVQTNGAPVAGPVDLKVELSYTNAPTTILCTQDFTNIVLSNGVFHLKLDLNCGVNGSLADVLNLVPANESAAIRVTDVTHSKAYSFQAIHSMPFASVSGTARQLVQMGATNNQVLKWNDTTKKWEPGSIAGAGTVTSVSGALPISVATGSSTPVVSIAQANSTTDGYLSSADWNAFNSKQGSIAAGTTAQYYRGDKTWQTLDTSAVPENVANLYFTNARALGVPLTGFVTGTGAIIATDTTLQAFGKAQGQINAINTASSNYLIKNSTDSITGVVNVGTIGLLQLAYTPVGLNDATNKSYVDAGDNLKVNKAGDWMSGVLTLDSDLKIKGGANYVTLKGHASSSAYNLILPSSAGTAGYVLSTDGSGNTSWINPSAVNAGSGTVTSASIVDGTIVDVDISATAAIAQSKIANLTTDLGNKVSTTLASGKILVGSTGNVASAVAVSGDATLSNTGALTLANSGATAGTFNSVTVDAKGRVTGGTNPTTLAGYGITDVLVTGVSVTAPITNTGTASVPLIGMPAATTTVDGYLKASDWTIFNNKQAAITAASTLNTGSITSNIQGGVVVGPYGTAAGNTGEIRLKELAANGANYVALRSPDALAADILFTLPTNVGSAGQVLTTDGLNPATLSWTNVATTGTSLVGDIGGTIGANTIGAGKVTLTHLSATGTTDATTYLAGDNTWKNFNANVIAAPLTGLSSAGITKANGTLAASDSITTAFNKLVFTQGDYVSKTANQTINGTLAINSLTGFITVPTPLNPNDAANKSYVDGFGQWIKGSGANAADIYFNTGHVGIGTTTPSADLEIKKASVGVSENLITTTHDDGSLAFKIWSDQNRHTEFSLYSSGVVRNTYGTYWGTIINPVNFANSGGLAIGTSNSNTGFGLYVMSSLNGAAYFGGNVGIGTTAPSAIMEVSGAGHASAPTVGSATGSILRLIDTSNTANYGGSVEFGGKASQTFASIKGLINNGVTNGTGDLAIYTRNAVTDAAMTERIRIQTGGNVGIGTTSPTTKLEVSDPTTSTVLKIGSVAASTSAQLNINSAAAGYPHILFTQGGAGRFEIGQVASNGNFYFNNNVQTGEASAAMVITKAGNVGIGTTAPATQLHISGSAAMNARLSLDRTSAGGRRWDMISGTNANNNVPDGTLFFWDITDNVLGLALSPAGNVGIGTASPSAKLDVNGAIIGNYLTLRPEGGGPGAEGGQLTLMGSNGYQNTNLDLFNNLIRFHSAYAGSVFELAMDTGNLRIGGVLTQSSDRRLKRDIRPLENSLEKILKIEGVSYKWASERAKRDPQIGLIAQDVEKVFPEVVKTSETGWKSVAYQNLVAPMIEAIKDLHKQVQSLFSKSEGHSRDIASVNAKMAELEADNAQLKKDNVQMKQENAAIKAYLCSKDPRASLCK